MPRRNDAVELGVWRAASQISLLPGPQHEIHTELPVTEQFGSIKHLKKWLPQLDPDTVPTWTSRLTSRDVSLLLIQGLSVTILALNLAVTIWAAVKHGVEDNVSNVLGADNGSSCARVKDWNKWLHFGINGLSTLLLGASNYCSQLLIAPTRANIDAAHQDKRWLDIGVQSMRNLRRAPRQNRLLWIFLMLSSGLLHLFWNSAIFATTPFSTYSIGYVTADFMDDEQSWHAIVSPDLDYIRQNALAIPRLNNKDCIDRYAGRLSGLSSLLLVSDNVTMDHRLSYDVSNNRSSLLFNATTVESAIYWRMNSDWMCNKWNVPNRLSCTPKTMKSPYEDTWTLVRFQRGSDLRDDPRDDFWTKVGYCLPRDDLKNMDDKCVLRVSKVILSIVTTLNLVKCICIALTIRLHNQVRVGHLQSSSSNKTRGFIAETFTRALQIVFHPGKVPVDAKSLYLVTLGDAIASFLQNIDKETKSCGYASRRDFKKRWPSHVRPPRYASVRWFHAASASRWFITMLLCTITIVIVGFLLYMTIAAQHKAGVDTDIVSLGSYGIGTPQQFATALTSITNKLGPSKGFFFAVLFANMFQALVSALYLLCNNLLTVMVVAAEWNSYIYKRKTLRLTAPKGIQRSSYFLSLPYKYSGMLMALSGLLHFLISQSVFVVQTVAYQPSHDSQKFVRAQFLDASCIGFSSLGIMLALATGSLLILYLLFVGFTFRYCAPDEGSSRENESLPVPLVSTCSAAISANCHRHQADEDCARLPLQWGFVMDANGERCTFTTCPRAESS